MTPVQQIDVFLSYMEADWGIVRDLDQRLRRGGLKVFSYKTDNVPGQYWQSQLEVALKRCRSFVVFVGPESFMENKRGWQRAEVNVAQNRKNTEGDFPLIPVLLPGSVGPSELPPFLQQLHYIDFREGLENITAFKSLLRGIEGEPAGGDEVNSWCVGLGARGRDSERESLLVSTLTRLLPSPGDFQAVAKTIGIDRPASVSQRSPMDRWHGLVGLAHGKDGLAKLRKAAMELLPPRREPELTGKTHGTPPPLTDRSQVSGFLDNFVEEYIGRRRDSPTAPPSSHRDLGLLALDQNWIPPLAKPVDEKIEEWLSVFDKNSNVYRVARDQGYLTRLGEFKDRQLGLVVAADFLARHCHENPQEGREFAINLLPHLAKCDATKHEILIHYFAWWPDAAAILAEFLEKTFESAVGPQVDHLLALTFAERLQREAGLKWTVRQIPMPISIQWAKKAKLEIYIASILEILGEDRVKAYLEQMKTAGPGRIALARAIRRIARPGSSSGDVILDEAIEASRPETDQARVLELIEKPKVGNMWFNILPLDFGLVQIKALEILMTKKPSRGADRSAAKGAERLWEHADLALVWRTLGSAGRRRLVELFDPKRQPITVIGDLWEKLRSTDNTISEGDELEILSGRLGKSSSGPGKVVEMET
jgi:hypothetical protein